MSYTLRKSGSLILTSSYSGENLIWSNANSDILNMVHVSGSGFGTFYSASIDTSESRSLGCPSWKLIHDDSHAAVVRTPITEASGGEIFTIRYYSKVDSVDQWNQITTYLYKAGNVFTKSMGGSVWGPPPTNSTDYYECVQILNIPNFLEIESFRTELKRGSANISPNLNGSMWMADISVKKGMDFNEHKRTPYKTFDGNKVKIDQYGNFQYYSESMWQDFFPFGLYPDLTQDFNIYKNQGFNLIVGNWPSTGRLKSCSLAGMKYMPEYGQYCIVGGDVYNDTDHLINSLNYQLSSSYYDDAYFGCWWDNEQYNQWDVPNTIFNIIKDVMTSGSKRDTPILMHVGNIGMVRPLQDLIDGSSVYTIIESTWDDTLLPNIFHQTAVGNNIEGSSIMTNTSLISMFGDLVSEEKFKASIYGALANGVKSIILFKDGKPSDVSGHTTYDITQMRIWDSIPTRSAEIQQMLPLIKKAHWADWEVSSSNIEVYMGQRNYDGHGHLFIINAVSKSSDVNIFVNTSSLYTPGDLINFIDSSSIATASINNEYATYSLSMSPYESYLVRISRSLGDPVADITEPSQSKITYNGVNYASDQQHVSVTAYHSGTAILTASSEDTPSNSETFTINIAKDTSPLRYVLVVQ